MAWFRYKPTPGSTNVRYRNPETGETISRRQFDKAQGKTWAQLKSTGDRLTKATPKPAPTGGARDPKSSGGTWERVKPTPGKNTVRYRNPATGETISRRQYEKQTIDPKKYNQYYRKGVINRKTEKFTKRSQTKHKTISVTRWQDIEKLIATQKPPKSTDVTAFVRVTNTATGEQKQTNSVVLSGDWRYLLQEYAVSLARKYFTPPDNDGEGDDSELSDDELDALVDMELEYELVFVTDL